MYKAKYGGRGGAMAAMRALAALSCLLPQCFCVQGEARLPFHSLAIGGGGFTSGIVPTARSAVGRPTVFIRTDVGGMYRLGEGDTWIPLVDKLTYRDRNRYGGDAIAVSWTNASRVWVRQPKRSRVALGVSLNELNASSQPFLEEFTGDLIVCRCS